MSENMELTCLNLQDLYSDHGELTIEFSPVYFDDVAKIMRPHKKPRLTAEQKKASADRLKPYHFPKTSQTPAAPRGHTARSEPLDPQEVSEVESGAEGA